MDDHESDIEWERLELERARLKLDSERVALEKARERTMKLQIGFPILVSILAIGFSAFNERQRSILERERSALEWNKAASSYNEGRFELFKKMAEHTNDGGEITKLYAEIFPRDSISLRNEQRDTVGK